MRTRALYAVTTVALLAFSAVSLAQSGSRIGAPSTGSSADAAGSAGTTTPRSNSGFDSGIASPASPGASSITAPSTCANLAGSAREQCLRSQPSPGTAGAGSTGMGGGSGSGSGRDAGGGPAPGGGTSPSR